MARQSAKTAKPGRGGKGIARKASQKLGQAAGAATVEFLNIHRPGKTYRVNAKKYHAARKAFLGVLPAKPPGLTQTEMAKAMRKALPFSQFPGSTTSWWMKTVQLDAEARGEVSRDGSKPLRWRKVK